MNGRLTITEVAERVGVTARTIRRWETARKVKKQKGIGEVWRVYDHDDIEEIIAFHDMGLRRSDRIQ
jgi:DNA-binding transcriptional MerR regulator